MKKSILTLLFMISLRAFSQDIHFSQFYASPMYLNPAFTGVFNGNVRINGNYRNQWQSVMPTTPFKTFAASVDFSGRSGSFNRVGGGISVYSDKAGSSELTTTNFTGSFAYTWALGRGLDYYLAVGGQVGINQRSINYAALTFGTQYQNNVYDALNATGEEGNIIQSITVTDGSMGFLWFHSSGRTRRTNQYIGGGLWHMNRPNLAFIDNDDDRIFTKIMLHGGASIKMSKKNDFLPMLMIAKQGPAFEITPGALFKFILTEKKTATMGGTAFYIGPIARISRTYNDINMDAFIIATKFDLGNITFGVSYDINTSSLKAGSSLRGGPELSFQYISNVAHKKTKYFCPRFN